jgi:multimeric flavodoxin WrbA
MSQTRKVLLLMGSPKGEKSVSNNIASYILNKFNENGVIAEKIIIVEHIKTDEALHELVLKVINSDILILISPLYVDSIPSITIKVMEEFYKLKNSSFNKKQSFMAIFNCGFPEPHHNDLALDMCKKFASDTELEWMGGVTIGMGPSLEGQSLDRFRMAKNLCAGLDMALTALCKGESVPREAMLIASKPLMPLPIVKFLMCNFGRIMWGNQMDKSAKGKMFDRPYES